MAFQTEYPFTLPKGFVDSDGNLHRQGVMRLATAKDEIVPLQDYRVQSNRAYLVIIFLSRVITKLGDIKYIDTDIDRESVLDRSGLSAGVLPADQRGGRAEGPRQVPLVPDRVRRRLTREVAARPARGDSELPPGADLPGGSLYRVPLSLVARRHPVDGARRTTHLAA